MDERTIAIFDKNAAQDVRVRFVEHFGHKLVDVRIFTTIGAVGDRVPTRKGLSISYDKVSQLIAALVDAEAELRVAGLIGDQDEAA